jgi:hypothetical protein
MELRVGREEELDFIAHLVEKHCFEINKEGIRNDKKILDVKEYGYLQYLVFKYCYIQNAAL